MRSLIQLVVTILLFSSTLFSSAYTQNKVVKEINDFFDVQSSKWYLLSKDYFSYNSEGWKSHIYRETSFYPTDTPSFWYYEDFEYDERDNLTSVKYERKTDTTNSITKYEYEYNHKNKVIERRDYFKGWNEDSIYFEEKVVYDYLEDENKHTTKRYHYDRNQNSLFLVSFVDTVFDFNGCRTRIYYRHYDQSGTQVVASNLFLETKDSLCRVLSWEYFVTPQGRTSLIPTTRKFFEYLDDGKTVKTIREQNNLNTNTWEIKSKKEKRYDDSQREIYFRETLFSPNGQTISLITYEYDSKGRLINQKHFIDDELHRLDSIIFVDNDAGLLIKKKEIRHDFAMGSQTTQTFHYDYYCNQQLKSITWDELPAVRRTTFEYETGNDCYFAKETDELLILPNPNSGIFEIRSSLLKDTKAEIELFSMTGQVLFRQIFESATNSHIMNIDHLGAGSYYIRIKGASEVQTKRILLIK